MPKRVLLVAFAALCTAITTAAAMPVAPAPTAVEIVEPARYNADGYHHHGFYYRQHGRYYHQSGRHHYGRLR